jgi:4-hydroxybenzoate polyprenyltransferase
MSIGVEFATREGRLRALLRLLSSIRFDEVLVLQGTPMLGAVFSIGHLTGAKSLALAFFFASSFCLTAHVFAINDWSGMDGDSRDSNRFARIGVNGTELFLLWIALLGISLLLFSHFGSPTLLIAVAIAVLSALYSFPAPHMKGVPLLSSALHLIGGLLHFLLGYSVFFPVDRRSLEIGCFFGIMFAAGHLTHEARDHDADRRNGIFTNAVTFGQLNSFVAGFALFTIANVWLVVLAVRGIVPQPLMIVGVAYAVYLGSWLRTLRAGLSYQNIRRLQVRYRIVYASVGLLIVISLIR